VRGASRAEGGSREAEKAGETGAEGMSENGNRPEAAGEPALRRWRRHDGWRRMAHASQAVLEKGGRTDPVTPHGQEGGEGVHLNYIQASGHKFGSPTPHRQQWRRGQVRVPHTP
jgi:hypothetical protein